MYRLINQAFRHPLITTIPLKPNLQLTFKIIIIIIINGFTFHFKTAIKILTHLISLVLLMKLHV